MLSVANFVLGDLFGILHVTVHVIGSSPDPVVLYPMCHLHLNVHVLPMHTKYTKAGHLTIQNKA